MTAVSTLAAIVLTPPLTLLYAGRSVGLPALEILLDIVKMVIVPVCGGLPLRPWRGHRLEAVIDACTGRTLAIGRNLTGSAPAARRSRRAA